MVEGCGKFYFEGIGAIRQWRISGIVSEMETGGEGAIQGATRTSGVRLRRGTGEAMEVELDDEASALAFFCGDAPGHAGGVVGEAELAVRAEQDDAAVAAEPSEQIADGLLSG